MTQLTRNKEERRARCVEWMTRVSPTASPAASDNEGDDVIVEGATEEEEEGENEQVDVMDCIEGMLEFATQTWGEGDNTIQVCGIQ